MLKPRPRKTTIANRTAKLPTVQRKATASRAVAWQVCLGHLVGWDDRGPLVDFDGNEDGPLLACVSGTAPQIRPKVIAAQQEIVLLVDPRQGRPPVLLGVLRQWGSEGDPVDVEARVDGRRVEIEGRDEIVLRCGDASITLRRNGRVVIRGIQVETCAKGVNRIKGGSVSIN